METTTLGNAIRRLRLAGGWDQAKFAQIIGISSIYVSKLERDEKVPSLGLVRRMAALDVPDVYKDRLAAAVMDVPAAQFATAEDE